MGPKFKLTPHQRKEAAARKANGEPVREIARSLNVSHSTISRLPEGELISSRPGA
jgi:IS30 family transposase